MWFCTGLSNFVEIGWSPTKLWRHIDFTRWRRYRHKSTSGFWFGHLPHVGRPKAISVPNFDQISQSTAEILLLPVSENKRTGQDSQKSHKGVIFHLFGEKPPLNRFSQKNCTVVGVPDVITCANFWAEIFRGYDFTGGRIFRFPIDSFMGLTTVQPVISSFCSHVHFNIISAINFICTINY